MKRPIGSHVGAGIYDIISILPWDCFHTGYLFFHRIVSLHIMHAKLYNIALCAMYVCMYVGLCMYVCNYVCMYVCMYVCIVCMYMYMYECMYVCPLPIHISVVHACDCVSSTWGHTVQD